MGNSFLRTKSNKLFVMVIRDLIENIYLKKKCKSLDKKFFRIGTSILKPKKIERS